MQEVVTAPTSLIQTMHLQSTRRRDRSIVSNAPDEARKLLGEYCVSVGARLYAGLQLMASFEDLKQDWKEDSPWHLGPWLLQLPPT